MAAIRKTWQLLLWNHVKFWLAMGIGAAVALAAPATWEPIIRILVGWNLAILLLVALMVLRARLLDAGQLRARYEDDDPTALVILVAGILGALLSVLAHAPGSASSRPDEPGSPQRAMIGR